MKNSSNSDKKTRKQKVSNPLVLLSPLLLIPLLYLLTLAHTPVLGDPTEYTLVAHTLGIAHPPGYAFITILGKLFQTLIPIGTIPWRMHLLSATAATLATLAVYGIVWQVAKSKSTRPNAQFSILNSQFSILFAALTIAFAPNFWQHAIHANPHIITATFLATNLYLLTKWHTTPTHSPKKAKYLYLFCISAGLGVTHHPLTVFSFPAYTLFILTTRPTILKEWRTLLKMVGFALLGLSVWLYFPLRSPMQPQFGPHDLNTLDGFLNVALARGLRVNLFHFGLADQFDRALIFWTTLRLQYSLPTISLALFGAVSLARWGNTGRKLLLLYGGAFLCNYIFVINTVQDVMAYLLGPFLLVGLFAGIGLWSLVTLIKNKITINNVAWGDPSAQRLLYLLVGFFFLWGPILQIVQNVDRVSLRDYNEGSAHVQAIFDQFAHSNQNAILLHDWEHMTPVWYSQHVENHTPNPADVTPVFVASDTTWTDQVFNYLGGHPVYTVSYSPEIVAAGFRLRPEGHFYRVVETNTSLPPHATIVTATTPVAIVGYQLPDHHVTGGDFVPLVLSMRTVTATTDFYAPVLQVGEGDAAIFYPFTTDSHVVSPLWKPNEIIVERFDFALPHNLPGGAYPVTVHLHNLSQDQAGDSIPLGVLSVSTPTLPRSTSGLLANFRQRVGLVSATVSRGVTRRTAPWEAHEPLPAKPGDILNIRLRWESLAKAEDSYVIFVHLIDEANRPLVALDYTPLGGATPTHLWIPKWLPGQTLYDPYRLEIPPDLPSGTYFIEVGLYEMSRSQFSGRRLHRHDEQGNLIGDRYILGSIVVE